MLINFVNIGESLAFCVSLIAVMFCLKQLVALLYVHSKNAFVVYFVVEVVQKVNEYAQERKQKLKHHWGLIAVVAVIRMVCKPAKHEWCSQQQDRHH